MKDNLANLFIVGAAKCGTTSLYEYLSQHPQIYMSPVKEPHFFSDKVENEDKELYKKPIKGEKYHTKVIKDMDVYASLFNDSDGFKIRGEASPSYLWDIDVAAKIYKYNPDSKIIAILRSPIDRLVSAYQMDHSAGKQNDADFLSTVKNEYKKESKIWGYDRIYLDLGFYYKQLSVYAGLFPAAQILVLKFDDLVKRPSETLLKVLEFLDVDAKYLTDIEVGKVHNESATIKYPFLKKLKKAKLLKSMVGVAAKRLKFLKKFTHKKGYSLNLVINDEARIYLNEMYHDDLIKLKEVYNIEF